MYRVSIVRIAQYIYINKYMCAYVCLWIQYICRSIYGGDERSWLEAPGLSVTIAVAVAVAVMVLVSSSHGVGHTDILKLVTHLWVAFLRQRATARTAAIDRPSTGIKLKFYVTEWKERAGKDGVEAGLVGGIMYLYVDIPGLAALNSLHIQGRVSVTKIPSR